MKIKHIWVNLSLFDGAAAGEGATGESSGESAPSAAETESGEGEYTEEEMIEEWTSYCHEDGEFRQALYDRRMFEVKLFLYGEN